MKLYCIGTSHGKPEKKYTGMLLEVNGNYYVIDAGTSIEEFMIAKELPVEKIRVKGIRTDHIHGFETFAYLVEAEGKRVLFAGDLSGDMHDYPELALKEKLDVMVCKLTHMRNEVIDDFMGEVIEKIQSSQTERFVFNHVHPKCE